VSWLTPSIQTICGYSERPNGQIGPGLKAFGRNFTGNRAEKQRELRGNSGKRNARLALAFGALKLGRNMAQAAGPLVMKVCTHFPFLFSFSHAFSRFLQNRMTPMK